MVVGQRGWLASAMRSAGPSMRRISWSRLQRVGPKPDGEDRIERIVEARQLVHRFVSKVNALGADGGGTVRGHAAAPNQIKISCTTDER